MSLQIGPANTLIDIPYVPPIQISQDENIDNLNVSKNANIVGDLTVNGFLSALGGTNISGGGGGSLLDIKDEGVTITPSASSLNFIGTSVTATNNGNAVTISMDLPSGLISGSTVLRASNNLSDVSNASASLANLNGASIAFSIAMSVAL